MTPRGTRILRGGLLLLALGVAGAVVSTLHRPAPEAPSSPSLPAKAADTRLGGFHHEELRGGRIVLVMDAQTFLGKEQEQIRLGNITARFPYLMEQREGHATITSRECVYTPSVQGAVFRGAVFVKTDDGMELRTESLTYRGDKGIARTDDPVEFRDNKLDGSSTGMEYKADEGALDLFSDVHFHIQGEADKKPTEITSQRAALKRGEQMARFFDDVRVEQGTDSLQCGRLVVTFQGEKHEISHVLAMDQAQLRTSGGQPVPGISGSPGGKGPRVLKGKTIEIAFREDRSIEEVTASPEGDLTILPARGERPEKRRLRAHPLAFRFDEKGRIAEIQGQHESDLVTEPLRLGQKAVARNLSAHGFLARLDPETGETREIEFGRDIDFVEGSRHATAEKGWYDGEHSLLLMKGSPHLWDEAKGSELTAVAIDLGTQSGDIVARHNARHVIHSKKEGAATGPFGGDPETPTVFTCKFFNYENKTQRASYKIDALLRSGKDEVRAPEIRTEEIDGKERLTATGGVMSLVYPHAGKPEVKSPSKPAAPVETRSNEMVYEEALNQVDYVGDVVTRQGDITTRSPRATATFTADHRTIVRIVAGEPVEVEQADRRAKGQRGVYTPAEETLVLTAEKGNKVLLKDLAQEARGRSLTFHVGADRIVVEGREEIRVETILRKEPTRP